jgi:hypothetical protein
MITQSQRKYARQYYQRHRKRIITKSLEYYYANREQCLAREEKYRRERGVPVRVSGRGDSTGPHRSEYNTYRSAMARCRNPKNISFAYYGGRGIEFRFASFEEFLAKLGPRPAGMLLDRIDNDGHYEPGNVRWATPGQSANNRRKRNSVALSLSL